MQYICHNHQGKATALVNALNAAGYKLSAVNIPSPSIEFVLTDSDVSGRKTQLERARSRGVGKFFIYPHTARPSLINTIHPTWEYVTAQFVVNEYHAEVLRAYGYSRPIECIGWSLSAVNDFRPRNTVSRVLFAPIHPRNAPIDREMNRKAFELLYRLAMAGDIDLTVRYIGAIEDNGIEIMRGVEYVNGKLDIANVAIQDYDVIIGHQTIAWLAVALGIPCVMFAEDMPTHFQIGGAYQDVPNWRELSRLFRYPLDLFDFSDPLVALQIAIAGSDEVVDWKRRMIGAPFDAAKFISALEKY